MSNEYYMIIKMSDDGEAGFLYIDDFQLVFDNYNKQIRINLTNEQACRLSAWEWRPAR